MKRDNWPVGKEGIRPAGPPDKCFYCGEQYGNQHKAECVVRERTVVVQATFELVIKVPESWSKWQVVQHWSGYTRNCVNNMIDLIDKASETVGCACEIGHTEFVREATVEDEQRFKLFVEDSES